MRAREGKERPMKQKGFSLIEIVTVVAMIGILAVIAIPSYRGYVRKSHRAAAKAALVDAAQGMERWMTRNGRYDTATVSPTTSEGGGPSRPAIAGRAGLGRRRPAGPRFRPRSAAWPG